MYQSLRLMDIRVRDPNIWTAAAKAMYGDAITFFPQFPPKLQTIGFPILGETASDSTKAEANAILLAFLAKLEAFLNLKSSSINYTLLWDQEKPDPALPPLSILLNRTYPTLISKEQTKNVRNPFYADYAAVHDGRVPFVDPVPRVSFCPYPCFLQFVKVQGLICDVGYRRVGRSETLCQLRS